MSWLDSVLPVSVGHRTEITVFATAAINLLGAFVPGLGAIVPIVDKVAPLVAALFAAARATRATAAPATK